MAQCVNVTSEDGQGHRASAVTEHGGIATFQLDPGEYLVSVPKALNADYATIEAGKTTKVEIPIQTKGPARSHVPWTQYFNQQFPLCRNEYWTLKAAGAGLPPTTKLPLPPAREYISRCMVTHVRARVIAAHGEEYAGPTESEFQAWYAKNSDKFDGLE